MTLASTSSEALLLAKCVALVTCRHDDSHSYALPFRVSERYAVIQGYGGSYSHTGDSHYSIDFGMPIGTTVCAARGGMVTHVVDHYEDGGTDESFKSKWNVVEIMHSDMSVAVYGHLAHEGSLVSVGDAVTRGQPIAYSGNTGWPAGPHLHFHVLAGPAPAQTRTLFATRDDQQAILVSGRTYDHPNGKSAPLQRSRRTMRWTEAAAALLRMIGRGSPLGQR